MLANVGFESYMKQKTEQFCLYWIINIDNVKLSPHYCQNSINDSNVFIDHWLLTYSVQKDFYYTGTDSYVW